MTGIEAFLEILAGAGVRYLFGNPGTTELPLTDALANDRRFTYIFGLQEIPIVAAADGLALASGQVGVANVHISCGLGNALGMLYNAHCEGSPLLLTAGQQDRRLRFDEPVLEGDLVSVTKPWTKWSAEVQRVEDLPNAVRRAVQVALTPPTGPVFLSLPVDVQLATATGLDLSPPARIDPRIRPAHEALQRAARVLASAKNPALVAGSRVTEANATHELGALAELLGCPVFAENTTSHGRLPIAASHPLYAGILPYWSPQMRDRLAEFDVLLLVGMNVMRLYIHHEPARPIPEHIRLIQLDSVARELGKNFPIEVGLLADPKAGLDDLHSALVPLLTPESQPVRAERRKHWARMQQEKRSALLARIEKDWPNRPLTPAVLMGALAKVLPKNVAVVEEAITTHQNVLEQLGFWDDPTGHFAQRGWALGWGLGCALGVQLAWPDRPVLALLGDGAALYGIQGLWTAAHHQLPVVFLVCNNRQYKILKVCGEVMPLPEMAKGNYLATDLVQPEIDFVGLAQSFGVAAQRLSSPEEVCDRLPAAFRAKKPMLFEIAVS